ncbi:hypothetical protein [Salipiger sp. PrR002]|uniref:hypothetical protein n=1 Tax=Salipiger sp. PrR002 TaxID=2706489 RepID=UPI0013B9084E|nr:hypothetical protein [Salipiger sp. PrR002]NDW02050.1 hypothetical protein [Salipiger sp. PrR002]NDW59112.1 hypothetical protein [Salipiger sp. PrR004]
MLSETTYAAGSPDWLAMVGEVLVTAARAADLPADLTLSLVEHYIDGPEIAPGLFQGLRFDITNGVPSFRAGVRPSEAGDITIHVTPEVAQRLNQIYTSDPTLAQVQQAALASGQFRVEGDPSRLGAWFAATHDAIVSRTASSSLKGPHTAPPNTPKR